jgi:subtilisin family serine protease
MFLQFYTGKFILVSNFISKGVNLSKQTILLKTKGDFANFKKQTIKIIIMLRCKMKIKSILMLALIFTLMFNSLGIQNTFSASEEKTYLIGINDAVNLDNFIEKNNLKDKKVKKIKGTSLIVSTLNQSDAMNLQSSPDTRFIEEDGSVELTSIGEIKEPPASKKKKDEETIPWGMKEIGVDLALNKNLDGKHIKIAVIDTGISNHPDLKISGGVSFVDGSTSYSDDNGHGTHVAGTVAALHNNIGVAGSGSNSDIFAVKVLNENGTGSISQVIQGIEWATENQMNIISMSLGTLENSRAFHEAILKAHNNGILIIAAAEQGYWGQHSFISGELS